MTIREKHLAFAEFYKKAKPYFRFIQAKDTDVHQLSSIYGFCITPGSRNGGLDKRIVEVFWGNRPFDRAITVNGLNTADRLLLEYGATLHYQLLDNGNVIVSLYPAWTDNRGFGL